MRKRDFAIFTALSLFLAMTPAFATPPPFELGILETPGTTRVLALPPAADNSRVISLGTAVDPVSGEAVEGYAIIHYARGGGSMKRVAPSCYEYLAKGAKWKWLEPWIVNPTNSRGLDGSFVFTNLTADIAKWEDAADGVLGNGSGYDILGDGAMTDAFLAADTASPDGLNEVYFGDVSSSGAIAVTIVWGVFSGPASGRKLVEWDQVYDDVDFDWSSIGEAGKMDFENIATHELGHAAGMGDLYNLSCSEETMYGYATSGETKKRDLHAGDIAGINNLY